MSAILKELPAKKTWEDYKLDIVQMVKTNGYESEDDSIAFARTFCNRIVKNLWKQIDYRNRWKCRQISFSTKELDFSSVILANEVTDYFLSLNTMEYAFLLGTLYTLLLPPKYRSDNGIYYTPPVLAERLLDVLAVEGADWATNHILDPACGGGAFLVTVANRMLGDYRIKELSAEEKLAHIEQHLAGIEIDKFAGWITQVLLDIIVYSEALSANRRLKCIIKTYDSIKYALNTRDKYNVIVGNPPYGRIKLDDDLRSKYSRSLYGHANLYGLFIDASLRMMEENGLVGFVTPTSFLGGKYFTNLRSLLYEVAPPLTIDFVSLRSGVFDKVLQETCLVTFGQNQERSVMTSKINIENNIFCVERIGNFIIQEGIDPWILPREQDEANIISKIKTNSVTLKDYGYKVSTGQLVWNRLKEQIKEKPSDRSKPIIWAEAITSGGKFQFKYQYRKKLQYIDVAEKQKFLICDKSVVLIQRTTAKEQSRRLKSCVLPQEFIDEWNGVVVENHVNIIQSIVKKPKISSDTLSILLNSKVVDRIFRCLSGSVAVSATELHALPLPPINKLRILENMISNTKDCREDDFIELAERLITKAYGLEITDGK